MGEWWVQIRKGFRSEADLDRVDDFSLVNLSIAAMMFCLKIQCWKFRKEYYYVRSFINLFICAALIEN